MVHFLLTALVTVLAGVMVVDVLVYEPGSYAQTPPEDIVYLFKGC
jgi:hypothetical protein